jgi:hypothetical protein
VSPLTIAEYKLDNLATTIGVATTPLSPRLRDRQFYIVRYALSALLIPYVCAFFFARSPKRLLRAAGTFAWISLGGILVWCIAIYLPGSTVVHVGSYFTMMLMFAAGGIVATEWAAVMVATLLFQFSIFVTVWLYTIPFENARSPSGALASAILIVLAGTAFYTSRRLPDALGAWLRPKSYRERTMSYLHRHWRELRVVAAVAAVMPLVTYEIDRISFSITAPPASLQPTAPRLHSLRGAVKMNRRRRIEDVARVRRQVKVHQPD